MKGLLLQFSCLLLFSIITLQVLSGQVNVQFISGLDGETLIGVHVIDRSGYYLEVSDTDGMIEVPIDMIPLSITCKYVGHEAQIVSIQEDNAELIKVVMQPNAELINPVEIVGRSQERGDLMPQRIEVISQAEIQSQQSNSSADIISNSGSVYVQRSQSGGGSPVMRGFEANKVLLVVDGVRLNNLIYRSGHLQNAITVDHSSLENLELIFGPGSLMYGSDALGGVIHFETLAPKFNRKQKVSINSQFTSANLGTRLNLTHSYGSNQLASATSLSLGRYDDQRVGQNRPKSYQDFPTYGLTDLYYDFDGNLRKNLNQHIQRNTGYSQVDFLHKMKFVLGSHTFLSVNAQLSTSTNVPRYDQLSVVDDLGLPEFKKWHYGPQNRLLLSPKLELSQETRLYDKAVLIASFQDIEESRITQQQPSDQVTTQLEDVKVYGLTADFNKTIKNKLSLHYGLDLHHNTLKSAAESVSSLDEVTEALTRYPDGLSNLTQYGAYTRLGYYLFKETLRLTIGGRFSGQSAQISYESMETFKWPDYFYDGISNTTSAAVAAGSATYKANNFSIKYALGQGFRAPNIDDLAKVRVKNDEITIPNTSLSPERTLNHDLSIKYSSQKIVVTTFGYFVKIDDVIVRQSSTLPGGSAIFIDETGQSLNVTANFNANEGVIFGGGMVVDFNPVDNLSAGGKINFTKGMSREDGLESPLGHIPPLFGWAGLKYKLGDYDFSLDYHFNGEKPIEDYGGSVDNPEYALAIGTPAWSVIDFGGRWSKNKLVVRASIENILDTFYRPFASGVSGSGRSFNVSIGLKL